MKHVLVALCVAFVWPLFSRAGTPLPFQLEDLQKIVGLREPKISPDGKKIAVVVSTPDWKEDKSRQEIDLIDVASGARRSLTWKRSGIAQVRWSPDGTRLAFLARDDETREPQVYVMPMDGGDALRLTQAKRGIDAYAWSPDGKQIAYATADDPVNEKEIKTHNDAFQVTDNHFLTRAALTPSHVWLVPSAGGVEERLTQGAYSVQTDEQDSPPVLSWSRDGRSIAVTRFPGPYWGPSFRCVIVRVSVDGNESYELGKLPELTEQGASNPRFAPEGATLAFARPRNGDQNNGSAVYVLANGATRDATRALARHIRDYAWLPNGKALLLSGYVGTDAVLWEQPLSGTAKKLDLGEVQVGSGLSVAKNGAIAFVGSTATHPSEVFVMSSTGAKPRRLTDVNAFAEQMSLARSESFEWDGPNGFREDGVLTYPVGYCPESEMGAINREGMRSPDKMPGDVMAGTRATTGNAGSPTQAEQELMRVSDSGHCMQGQKYPLVVLIHGGPTATSTRMFSPLPQLLAAQGFLVLQPNYRGSTNLGDAYQHAIFQDAGDGPGKDVMAGLTALEKRGIVDESRIGVSGWSYGGYMTAWLSGHYPVWKAAVAGAALTDWMFDYTLSYYQQGDVYLFGGPPTDAKYRDLWREQSPILYAHAVTAPTLILGDVGDANVPLVNSYAWYHALRDAGVPVEFYAYPVDAHFPRDIVRTTDVYRRWVQWMNRHLK
ncbi:MAG: S9 family peptidase [Rhodanobacter sp.]|jgi:dipeptidyl aminopeptidase/acylaminoacyl peptidase|nr:S9 family peptidase [Rhodanobacter sp.]